MTTDPHFGFDDAFDVLRLRPQQDELNAAEDAIRARDGFAQGALEAMRSRGASPFPEEELPEVSATGTMSKLARRMCLVRREDGSESTGFLVGADLMLTTAHSLRGTAGIFADPDMVTILFDQFEWEDEGGKIPHGAECKLRTVPGRVPKQPDIVASSIRSDPETGTHQRDDKEFDYVLVRLDRAIGLEYLPDSHRPRGWNDIHVANDGPEGEVKVVQHPFGGIQRFASGALMPGPAPDFTSAHFRYRTRTFNGSSGGAIFNKHFRIVGLHVGEFEDTKPGGVPDTVQLGVNIQSILEDIHDQGVDLPPFPPPRPVMENVFGRSIISEARKTGKDWRSDRLFDDVE